MNVLVVAAHPDDEVLGCGGTIAKHIAKGDEVSVLFMTNGVSSRGVGDLQGRNTECLAASSVLGVKRLNFKDYPDNQMSGSDVLPVSKDIASQIEELRPEIVYTHSTSDLNRDHRITAEATFVACRPMSGVKLVLSFEVLSSTEWGTHFKPNWFEDITETLATKLAAMAEYKSELRDFPHPRSLEAIEHLARLRGSTANVPAAEAFILHRMIQ